MRMAIESVGGEGVVVLAVRLLGRRFLEAK